MLAAVALVMGCGPEKDPDRPRIVKGGLRAIVCDGMDLDLGKALVEVRNEADIIVAAGPVEAPRVIVGRGYYGDELTCDWQEAAFEIVSPAAAFYQLTFKIDGRALEGPTYSDLDVRKGANYVEIDYDTGLIEVSTVYPINDITNALTADPD